MRRATASPRYRLRLPLSEPSRAVRAMRPARARVGTSMAAADPEPSPSSRIAVSSRSTTSTCAARRPALSTWTAMRPRNSSRPADHTSRVDCRASCQKRPRDLRWLRLSTCRSSGSTSSGSGGSEVTEPLRGTSSQQALVTQLGDEGLGVLNSRVPLDAVLVHEGVGKVVEGAVHRQQLGEVRPARVGREVDRPRGVEDDELAVDLFAGGDCAAQLHVRSPWLRPPPPRSRYRPAGTHPCAPWRSSPAYCPRSAHDRVPAWDPGTNAAPHSG